jgi:hypothetical protein
VTALHVVTRAGGRDPDILLEIDPLAGGNPFGARVERVDAQHDLAVLRGDGELDASVAGWGATDLWGARIVPLAVTWALRRLARIR